VPNNLMLCALYPRYLIEPRRYGRPARKQAMNSLIPICFAYRKRPAYANGIRAGGRVSVHALLHIVILVRVS
jgi:hypothetical protein